MSIYSIYRVVNVKNSKVYIGFDSNWPNRQKRHIRDSKNLKSKAYNDVFHKAIRKYGEENFVWESIYVSLDGNHCKDVMENYFITEYMSFIGHDNSNGYNMTLGGDGMLGFKHKESSKLKNSQSCGKIFKVWHKNGQLIEDKHIKNFCIDNNLNYDGFKKLLHGDLFSYKQFYPYSNEKNIYEVIENYQNKIKNSLQVMGDKHAKTYTLLSPEGKTVTFTNLAKFARENNLNPQSLKLLAMGKLKTNRGWKLPV